MFSFKPDSISKEIQNLYKFILEWSNSKEDASASQWQNILEKITPFVYHYPKFRFGADEDTCSEFYLFSLDYLKNMLESSVHAKTGFSFFVSKSMRMLYYRFLRKNKATSRKQVRIQTETELVNPNTAIDGHNELWNNFLYKNGVGLKKYFQHIDEPGSEENREKYRTLYTALAKLSQKEQALIKLQFGFELNNDEIRELNPGESEEKFKNIIQTKINLQKTLMKDRNHRIRISEEINRLSVKESHGLLKPHDKQYLANLRKDYWKAGKGLSIRELSRLTGKTKSALQRLIDKASKKLMENIPHGFIVGDSR